MINHKQLMTKAEYSHGVKALIICDVVGATMNEHIYIYI